MEIRTLRADEIEARVQVVKENGCSILLYKDARCDMRILDEIFGIGNWQRSHEVVNGNLFCNVGVRFERENGFGEWVWKQDVGTESYTDKEKGQASDSFKRACFNWGIGRELYTAPFVWIRLNKDETYPGKNGNLQVKTRFSVSSINYNTKREIIELEIKDDKGNVRYSFGVKQQKIDATKVEALKKLAKTKDTDIKEIESYYETKIEDMDIRMYTDAVSVLNKKVVKG